MTGAGRRFGRKLFQGVTSARSMASSRAGGISNTGKSVCFGELPDQDPYQTHTRTIPDPYRVFGVILGCLLGSGIAAQDIAVPSGQPLSFLEFISENEGDVVRFRFLAPQIGADFDYAKVFPDFQAVCDAQVMPVLDENALTPRQIVLSMSAVDIPFGEDDPSVLQFFEIFRPENGTCIWEEF